MALAPQTRFGPYEILEPIGAGGMGEVYRARDTKLGRDVAIKVLPAAFAGDADRMARFEREAHVLASLNHPGIATIHGLEESDSVRALVMELVPGPTLADRIAQGALPLEEALPIARQIAEAVEYAHERGIIHRDLKPANVKLTADGAVKVLDFGLAKALSDDPVAPDVSQSPTLSVAGTRDGMILGTAAYMSPEQIKGRPANRRSDIWSFGVVLFEMLTARRMFSGDTAAETLAAVLKTEPEWRALPSAIPRGVRKLLRRCLEKDPRRRLQAIGEARIAIDDVLAGVREDDLEEEPARARQQSLAERMTPWVAAMCTAVLALGLGLGLWAPWRAAPRAKPPLRLSIDLGSDVSLVLSAGSSLALSRDGSTLVFAGRKAGGGPQLYVRRLDQATASPVSGTENARNPFLSPDGQWIAFFADGKLKKVATAGGAVVTLCDAQEDRGGSWSEDGSIFFQPSGGPYTALLRVSSAGGLPVAFAKADPVARSGRWPQALPGGLGVLSTLAGTSGATGFDDGRHAVQPLGSTERKVVHSGGYHGRYVGSGHLLYIHRGTLFAAPFDLARSEVTGPAVPALEGVSSSSVSAGAHYAVADDGTLAYLPGGTSGGDVTIQWLDRHGKMELLRATPADAFNPRFSPDGRRLAMDISDGTQRDIWVYEWERDTMSRITFDAQTDGWPVWTHDGRRIVFASNRMGKARNLYWQRADGTGDVQRLSESDTEQTPNTWHSNGSLVFGQVDSQTDSDLMILTVEGDEVTGFKPGKPAVLLKTPFNESAAAFSPDGRWLAYQSNDSGRFEVYVRPFPGPGGKWQVSTRGGSMPIWSRARKQLVYRAPDRKLMVVPYSVERDSFRAEKPRLLSEVPFEVRGGTRTFDLHPDGERFAVLKSLTSQDDAKLDRLTRIFNFGDELRRIAPPGKR